MRIDQYELFSDNQAVTAAAASTNLIDLRGTARRFGIGAKPLYVVLHCTVTMDDSGNNSSVPVYLQTDTAAAFSSATNAQTLHTFATNTAANTYVTVPITSGANEQFARLYYDVLGGNLGNGSFTAFVTADPQLWDPYAVGYTGPTTA